jgi:hypothetical protein
VELVARFDRQVFDRIQDAALKTDDCVYLLYQGILDVVLPTDQLRYLQAKGIDTELLQNLELVVRSNNSELEAVEESKLLWMLLADTQPIGYGRLIFDDEHERWITYAAYVAYQGLGLYPAVLHQLYAFVGPFETRNSLSPGAKKAWERAGGTFHETYPGKGYFSMPR